MEDADIVIPADKLQDFFFMDDDEEQKEFGGNSGTKIAQATLSAGQLVKDRARDQASRAKQIQDFKVRVLDFVAIYIKETKKSQAAEGHLESLDIIKGLLKGLQVA